MGHGHKDKLKSFKTNDQSSEHFPASPVKSLPCSGPGGTALWVVDEDYDSYSQINVFLIILPHDYFLVHSNNVASSQNHETIANI